MFEKVLSKKTKKVLALLRKKRFLKGFYLAGGTGLALQLGHRTSKDLDFFSPKKFSPRKIIQELSKLGEFILEKESWGTVNGILEKVRISFLFYPPSLLNPPKKFLDIKIANPVDIALMKIIAIGNRGMKKDFIDLYFIIQKVMSLDELFALLPKKFKKVRYEPYHLILGLTYFKDADKEPMPEMFSKVNWPEIKRYFQKEAKLLLKQLS